MGRLIRLIVAGLLCINTLYAGEGMWLPMLLKQLNEAEMQAMGMKLSAEDIYSVNRGSLKDAIVQFGGGCTGELISANGLLLTNHHCGYGQIQSHSSLENNYVDNGFWAKTHADELPNAGLTAMFIVSMQDVTAEVLSGVTSSMTSSERQSQIDKNSNALRNKIVKEIWQDILIRPFYKGNQYILFITETYKDVRLVGAPPASIGNFGVDTDNWVWPRHTCDFSLFRIYADKDNKPAEYSKDNVPYMPKHYLPVSMSGIKEGDFTMVFGFPGTTNEYLPAASINQIVDISDPVRVAIRTKSLDIMYKYMMADKATKIKYVSKAARISNGWKKWQGEMEGLRKTNALGKKLAYEAEFQKRVDADANLKNKYGTLLSEINALITESNKYARIREYTQELAGANIGILRSMSRLNSIVRTFDKNGKDEAAKSLESLGKWAPGYFKDYDRRIDEETFVALFKMYYQEKEPFFSFKALEILEPDSDQFASNVHNLFENSFLSSQSQVEKLTGLSPADAVNAINTDPMFMFYKQMMDQYNSLVSPEASRLDNAISDKLSAYMAAQMEVFPEKRFYPDANGTMRVTYGKVNGYEPRDAVKYEFQTFLDGVIEKYVPGDYEFDLPPKLIELYNTKNYGPYAQDGKLPVAFIASNHTTGGNSGSPAIDAYGNLIGLNFDRVWEGTMSDYNYDASICRNIMVDIRYILFIIDKYADAGHLVQEMKLVYPM